MGQEMQVAASHISSPRACSCIYFFSFWPFILSGRTHVVEVSSGAEHPHSVFPLSSVVLISSSLPYPGLGTVSRPQNRCHYLKGPWPGGKCSRRGVSQGKKYQGSGLSPRVRRGHAQGGQGAQAPQEKVSGSDENQGVSASYLVPSRAAHISFLPTRKDRWHCHSPFHRWGNS